MLKMVNLGYLLSIRIVNNIRVTDFMIKPLLLTAGHTPLPGREGANVSSLGFTSG